MSLASRVLVGLLAGLALGLAIAGSTAPAAATTLVVLDTIGTLFVSALRMTVVPLVIASLVVGVASAADVRSLGRIGWRALVAFVAFTVAGSLLAVVVAQPLLARLPLDLAALQGVSPSSTAAATLAAPPTVADWLVHLVPANPFAAAADGAMLPLIVFTLLFAVALLRVPPAQRERVTDVFHGLLAAMLVLVQWVLVLAPLGVFALTVPLVARLGLGSAGAMLSYVGIVAALSVLFAAVVLYPAATLLGRVRPRTFFSGSLSAQAVAFSTRSSLASLPAMMEGAAARLRLPAEIATVFLPLAASLFRAGAGVGLTVGVLFVARLYGVQLGAAQLGAVVVTIALTSFSIPGIPNGSIIAMVPVLVAAHIPVAGVGILLALDTIPDMFRTTVNVTGDMAVATIIARGVRVHAGAGDAVPGAGASMAAMAPDSENVAAANAGPLSPPGPA